MRIIDLINNIKEVSGDYLFGKEIKEESTRDKVLYGNAYQECTGIITTCYASVDVIKECINLGYNFIIVHEALFWNHGDHTEWLKDNEVFIEKKALLEEYGICVWRFHDYMHAGIPVDSQLQDGIFYGMSSLLGWNDYIVKSDGYFPDLFEIPETSVKDIANLVIDKFRLNGIRVIGNHDCTIKKVYVPLHLMGSPLDNQVIERINNENIDCLMTMEIVDFTVNEYIRDAGMLGKNKCILAVGHFNLEEIGMEFLASHLPNMISLDVPVKFIQSGDTYSYIVNND